MSQPWMPLTQIRQRQIDKPFSVEDTLDLLGYDSVEHLEQDLNYIRSVIKDLKGTQNYNTPVITSLVELEAQLAAISLDLTDLELQGTPTAPTPDINDVSTRIATTEFVQDAITSSLVAQGADAKFIFTQGTPSTLWEINHNLNKFPAVTVIDSGGNIVFGNVQYIDANNVQVSFSVTFSGKAYLN